MMRRIRRNRVFIGSFLLLLLVFLSGCNSNEETAKNNYFLSLTGKSESWKLHTYEVRITPENFTAGNGTLTMNSGTEYRTDYVSLEFHAIVDGEDKVIQEKSVTGETDISKMSTGTIEGGVFIQEDGEPAALDAVEDMYMAIQWHDKRKNQMVTETMELFHNEDFFN